MEPMSSFQIRLESALLCLDLACNTVFDRSVARQCPACGSKDTYPLVVWLDRAEGPTRRRNQEAVVTPMRVRAA
jgi:hypothetical protein